MDKGGSTGKGIQSGLKINDVIVIMTLTTLFSPILVITSAYWNGDVLISTDPWIIAPMWTYAPSWFSYGPSFNILFTLLDPMVLVFSIVPVIYAIQVMRFSQEKTTYWKTMSIGILYTATLFIVLFFGSMWFLLSEGIIGYSGPIPIQLSVGYYLVHYFEKTRKLKIWID